MADSVRRKTCGQVDDMVMALVEAAYDKDKSVSAMVSSALYAIGLEKPELVLGLCKDYILKHQKLKTEHRVVLLESMGKIISDQIDAIETDLAKELLKLAFMEMTKSKEILPKWQTAASDFIVSLGEKFSHEVMGELLENLVPGSLPHYFVILTLANYAQANAFGLVPFLKDILGRLLPMLMLTKQDNMKWVFSHCFSRFSESIIYYIANIESPTLYNDVRENTFEGEMLSAYEIFFNVWIKSNEAKVRLSVIEAVGFICHLLSREKLEEQLPRLLSGVNNLYRKHTSAQAYTITQGLCNILEAAVLDGSNMLSPHLDHLVNDLYDKACVMPDFTNPGTVKNYNEVLRCFDTLCKSFSDRIIGYMLLKLDKSGEKGRIGSLSVLKHLVNSSGNYLENKKPLLVTGVQVVILDSSCKVKQTFAQLIAAMAHHGYLGLEGGQRLVEFIVRHCALNVDEEKPKKFDPESVSSKSIQIMCENILRLVTTTIDKMENVLWPYLLEFLVPEEFTDAMGAICQNICYLATKKREQSPEEFTIDFSEMVNLPKPLTMLARLLVMAGRPLAGKERGTHVLGVMQALAAIIHSDIEELWNTVIPKLTQYLEENKEDEEEWNQKAWENVLLKFFSKTIDEVDNEEWTVALGMELGGQISLYTNQADDKNFIYKCLGIVMKVVTKKDFVQSHLSIIFSTTKHADTQEKEGCAMAFGFCASQNLDVVLLKLEQITKTEMVPKSTGFLGLMKDKSGGDVEKIKSTVMWCFGYVALYGPPSLIASRLETSIYRIISPHLAQPKELGVKQSLIHCVDLIAKACHPNHLQQAQFIFSKRDELLKHMINYIDNESTGTMTSETRGIAIGACTQLIKLDPQLQVDDMIRLLSTCGKSVYSVEVAEKNTKEEQSRQCDRTNPTKLLNNALENVNELLSEIIRKNPTPLTLERLLKCVWNPWLINNKDFTRQRSLKSMLKTLETFEEVSHPGPKDSFFVLGTVLSYFIPRCTDPCTDIRQDALSAIQTTLRIADKFHDDEGKGDVLVKAFDVLKKRTEDDDSNVLFSVANDLAKVLCKKVPGDQVSFLIYGLIESLSDQQSHSSSGACVVLNSVFRIRGGELGGEIPSLAATIHDKLPIVSHVKTRTGTLRCFRTLASHHLVPLLKTLLDFPIPMDWDTVDIWKTLGGEPLIVPEVLDHLVNLLNISLPYHEKVNPKDQTTTRTATVIAMAVTYAFHELFWSEEITELVSKQFPRLFSCLLVRVGTCVDLKPPVGTKEKKDKGKSMELLPLKSALATMKIFLIRSQCLELSEYLDSENTWTLFEQPETFTDAVCSMARGICKSQPGHVRDLINTLTPVMSSAYDNQRVVATAFFSELINCQCGGELELIDMIVANLMGRLVDTSHLVRKYCIRGLGNVGSAHETLVEKHSTTILSAMMTGMDDRDDPESDLTLEAMAGLSKILAIVDESNVRHIFINICLRIRPCFEKDKPAVRAEAFALFGNLSRFGNGPSKGPFLEQIQANFISLLIHMNEEPAVTKACKCALRKLAPLMGSEAINKMFQKHLIEDANLHYGEFVKDLSRLMVTDFSDKVDFYIMGCVTFFKSSWAEVQCNAAIFLGFILGNLPENKRLTISKEYVCGALITLLKDPSAHVRCKAAEAMSLLYDY